jgi:hypothetical protein
MTSQLFQVRLNDLDLKMFKSPETQPKFNPKNCGAVTGQLLGVVSQKASNEMTEKKLGLTTNEWTTYIQSVIGSPVQFTYEYISKFVPTFQKSLLPGFGTFVVVLPEQGIGHAFVVAKDLSGRLLFLDPQIRKGFYSINEYFSNRSLEPRRFAIIIHPNPKTAKEHDDIAIGFLANALAQCNISSGEVYMDVEPLPTSDVVMEGTARRKRRKTKRRLVAKRTLRRMNRRRRIF